MKGKDRQTVADTALMAAGSEEAMFAMARSSGIALDSDVSGLELADIEVMDRRVVEHFARNGIVPANGLIEDVTPEEVSLEDDASAEEVTAQDPTTDVGNNNG